MLGNMWRKFLFVHFMFNMFNNLICINHWRATEHGIKPQIDSPYYLNRPDDLVSFLRQSDYIELIDILRTRLLAIKYDLTNKMHQSNSYTIDFMYQTECIINYFVKDSTDLYNKLDNKMYFNRISNIIKEINTIKDDNENLYENIDTQNKAPICKHIDFSMFCFEHLPNVRNRNSLEMAPEDNLFTKEIDITDDDFVKMIKIGLKNDPKSWKYPLLSSYYWRRKGKAKLAMECARLAVYLAPRNYKDIPLLSFGTILQRANKSADAIVLFTAAVDHAPRIAENQVAAANGYFMLSEFNKSIEFYETAKAIDSKKYTEKLKFMRKSMTCFKYIKKKLKQIDKQLKQMINNLKIFNTEKSYLDSFHDKLMQEQVPLTARLSDPSYHMYAHNLLDRSQYCATRLATDSQTPVLFCDFYTDLQMQLQELDITTIQNYLDTSTELIKNHMDFSIGIYRELDIENFSENLIGDNGEIIE